MKRVALLLCAVVVLSGCLKRQLVPPVCDCPVIVEVSDPLIRMDSDEITIQ